LSRLKRERLDFSRMGNAIEETYECHDLMIAAALLSRGITLRNTKNSGRFITFIFENPKECREIEEQWWRGTLEVTAPRFADAIKHCKAIIYGNKKN